MLQEFKKFLIKGNAVDLAVGFIFGAAFATVVKSFVTNILMPPIGLALGNVDFSSLYISLDGKSYESLIALEEAGAPAIKYGIFINDGVSFIILGFILFLIIRVITKMQKKEEEKPSTPPKKSDETMVLEKILDALKKKK